MKRVKFTPVYMSTDAFRLLVRSEHVNLFVTKYTYTQRISEGTYKHTRICDCKFSKHDGLETYIAV